MKNLSFRLDGLLKSKSVLGVFAKVPASFCWPPNFWTTIRLIGVLPVTLCMYFNHSLGFVCFVLLLYTDAIDGMTARETSPNTSWWLDPFFWLYTFALIKKERWRAAGEWYDPLADKIFISTCFFYFGLLAQPLINATIFYTMVAVELGNRGMIIPLVRKVIMKKPLYIKSNNLGKTKFFSEAIAGVIIMFYYVVDDKRLIEGANWLMIAAIILSIGSMLGHLWPERFIKLKLLIPD